MTDRPFRIYKRFNAPELAHYAKLKVRLHSLPSELFDGEDLENRLARSLIKHRVVHIKELLEAFEFYMCVRKRLRRSTLVDLCAGHGLVGLVFALTEERVTRVELIDHGVPATFERILAAFVEIAPWVREKILYRAEPLTDQLALPKDSGVLLVHGCGNLTDIGLRVAARSGGPVAVVPCCYGKAEPPRAAGLARALGRTTAIDVSRTYFLEDAGYQADWSEIPKQITPMNRVIVGWNREEHRARNARS